MTCTDFKWSKSVQRFYTIKLLSCHRGLKTLCAKKLIPHLDVALSPIRGRLSCNLPGRSTCFPPSSEWKLNPHTLPTGFVERDHVSRTNISDLSTFSCGTLHWHYLFCLFFVECPSLSFSIKQSAKLKWRNYHLSEEITVFFFFFIGLTTFLMEPKKYIIQKQIRTEHWYFPNH